MQIKTLKSILAVLLTAAVLLSIAPAAYSMDMHGGKCSARHMMGHGMKSIYIPIMVTGTKDNSTVYTVNSVAFKGMGDKAGVVTFDKPLMGVYNASRDMGFMPTKGLDGMTIRIDTPNNSTLPVAGAAAVMTIKGIWKECKTRDYSISSFDSVVIHLPDGTVKAYNLAKPVTMIKSKDRKFVVTDANPDYTKALSDATRGGNVFAPGTPPMSVQDLINSEAGTSSMKPGSMNPAASMPATVDYPESI
jgi:hypothetical protein